MKPVIGGILAGFLAMVGPFAASAGDVIAVRFGAHDDYTRIVIETDRPVAFETYTLSDPVARLVVSFDAASWNVDGLESGFGLGQHGLGMFRFDSEASSPRLVFDLDEPVEIRHEMALTPSDGGYRNVIDIVPTAQASFQNLSGFPNQPRSLEAVLAEEADLRFTPPSCDAVRVVIDPGHGGRDPGAVARFGGGHEKDVNLAAGLILRDLLQSTGRYEVVMTRDRDVFVELMDRVEIARQAQADLFISLHADASPRSSSPRGATVYSMNHRAVSRARNRAIRDGDWVDPSRPQEVSRILVEMSLSNKQGESERFADTLRSEIGSVAPLWRDDAMQANFAVLTDASVPAVLLEMGFLTNRADSRRMNNAAQQRRLMQATLAAIESQFAYCGGGQPGPRYIAGRGETQTAR